MIFYFTGTGNSQEVASIISAAVGESVLAIGKAYKAGFSKFTLSERERLGFVFPVYSWTTPLIIDEFLKKTRFENERGGLFEPAYCFVVMTCSSSVGNTAYKFASKLDEYHRIKLDASFSIRSVGNRIMYYTPIEDRKRFTQLELARLHAEDIAHSVTILQKGSFEKRGLFSTALTWNSERKSKHFPTTPFYAHPTCTRCGQCVDICPTNTIKLVGCKPYWSEHGCTSCLACIHHCPPGAIQYGKNTELRTRFINPAIYE